MALPQPVITYKMVLDELVKAGINKEIADDLAYRYYKNELTYKDLEYLKKNFDIKLKHLEEKIFDSKEELINRIDSKFNELDNKIDNIENNLNNKIDNVENNLNNKIDNKFKELDNKIDKNTIELKKDISNLEKHNKWIFSLTFTLWLTVLSGFIALIMK